MDGPSVAFERLSPKIRAKEHIRRGDHA
jgi:hypothetical protein